MKNSDNNEENVSSGSDQADATRMTPKKSKSNTGKAPVARQNSSEGSKDDKTRIARPNRAEASKDDKTRIARPNRAEAPKDDKTRIARPNRAEAPKDDKTRIARPGQSKASKDDKTRIARPGLPEASKDDKTRIARPGQSKASKDDTRIALNKGATGSDATQFRPAARQPEKDNVNSSYQERGNDPKLDQGSTHSNSVETKTAGKKTDLLKERFILEKVLGAGGMGVVYKAKDLVKVEAGDKEPYLAIKVLTDEFKEHPEAFIALQRESRKTQRIAHPNIVNVHDFDKDGDTVFMTMEYLEGKPLDQLIRQYKSTGLPTDEATKMLKNMCRALIHAHDQNIIHSDFKPGNIFVTDRGITKVFDFGIARAVAKAEHYDDNLEDKTIFDAGDLGALTPSYASYEMLDGKEPDVRDDIYALGCVAYELFTGSHPFNKIPADEAYRQKLKPKRITHITRRQWKAIEKALSFEREERVPSVKEFLDLISETESSYKVPVIVVLLGLVLTSAYFQFFREAPAGISEIEIRSELEYNLRLENYRNTIDGLITTPEFSVSWEDNLWGQIQGVRKLLETSDVWLESTTNADFKNYLHTSIVWQNTTEEKIYELYLERIRKPKTASDFTRVSSLINNAYRYTTDASALDEEMRLLKEAIAKQEQLEEAKRKERLAQEALRQKNQNNVKSLPTQKSQSKSVSPKQKKATQFKVALSNVHDLLKCQSNKLNMRNLDTAVQKLRSVDKTQYGKMEKDLVALLVNCINRIAKLFPERATEFKKYSLRIFDNNKKLTSIVIVPRDPCDKSLAGLGARGKRATCKDPIENIGSGPDLVVIPGKKGIQTFALGKYEVSIAELNLFCKVSSSCNEIKTNNSNLPVTKVSLDVVEDYLEWLSRKTKKKYRLPTKSEWSYAAKGRRISLDPNRNCKLNTRGITKGDKFVRSKVGTQNSWGLVNYVGNASEWVYDKGRKLVAVGGSYNIPMEQCNISTVVQHNGKADSFTGFRVYRELR